MFTTDKAFDTINSAMPKDSEAWFGKQPPDLSLMARAKRRRLHLFIPPGFLCRQNPALGRE